MKILGCSTRMKWKPYLEKAIDGFSRFLNVKKDFKLIDSNIRLNIDDYGLVICCSWYINEIGRSFFKLLKEKNIPIIFLSDGCFFYKKKSKLINDYPWAVFINGPQSAPWGDKHYRNDLPGNRVKLFSPEIDLKPWRKKGNSIVIAHQSGGDHAGNSKQGRYREILDACIKTKRPIIYRLHPNSSTKLFNKIKDNLKHIKNCKVTKASKDRNINLEDVHCLVTVGGKSAAKSIIQGIPAITMDVTIAEMVAEKKLKNIENPKMVDREPWIRWLSYCHWTLNEMNSGVPWKFFLDSGYLEL